MDPRTRRKVAASVLAVVMVLAGVGQTVAVKQATQDQIITGHTQFLETSTQFSGCFAGIAGLLMQRVTWFNGATLFTRADNGNGRWVYFTEHFEDNDLDGFDDKTGIEIKDPSKEKLFRTNQTYTFDDPDPDTSKKWEVREYFALRREKVEGSVGENGQAEIEGPATRVYVFAVKVAGQTYDAETISAEYNFVSVVDTCRFHGDETGTETHDNGRNNGSGDPIDQHKEINDDDGTHDHDVYSIDVWVGGAPDSLPVAQVPDDRNGKGNASATEDAKDGEP